MSLFHYPLPCHHSLILCCCAPWWRDPIRFKGKVRVFLCSSAPWYPHDHPIRLRILISADGILTIIRFGFEMESSLTVLPPQCPHPWLSCPHSVLTLGCSAPHGVLTLGVSRWLHPPPSYPRWFSSQSTTQPQQSSTSLRLGAISTRTHDW